jgi:PAS domain S-box-containing protein
MNENERVKKTHVKHKGAPHNRPSKLGTKLPGGEIVAINDEVTELKKAEEALRNSEEKFAKAFDASPNLMTITSFEESRIIEVNEAFCKLTGYRREECVDHTTAELNVWADSEQRNKTIRNVKENGYAHNVEANLRTRSGEIHSLIFSMEIITLGDKKYLLNVATDVTERKQAEKARSESEDRYRQIFDNVNAIIVRLNKYGKITEINSRVEELFGYRREDLLGKRFTRLGIVTVQDLPRLMKLFVNAMRGKHSTHQDELEIRDKDGNKKYLYVNTTIIKKDGKIDSTISIVYDITRRRQAEEALKNREEFLNSIIENTPNALWVSDEKGTIIRMNQSLRDLLKIKNEEIIGKYNIFKDTQVIEQGYLPLIKSVFKEGKTVSFTLDYDTVKEKQVTLAETTHRLLEIVVSAIKDKEGRVIHAIVQEKDVTERKQAEEALRESEDKFSKVFRSSGNAICITSLHDNKFIEVNDSFTWFTGYTREEVIGHSAAELKLWVHDIELQRFIGVLGGKGKFYSQEFSSRRKSGEIRIGLSSAEIINIGGKPCRIVVITDITERKRLEENLAEERQDYKLIIDSSPIIIFYKDKEGRFVRVNKAFAEALEIPEEKFAGKTSFNLYSAKIAQGMTNDDREVLTSGRPKLGIIEQYESPRGIRWVQTDKVPIFNKNGVPDGLIGFAQDITERKLAEEALHNSEENFRHSLDDSPYGILIVNSNDKIVYTNRSLLEIFGYASIEEFRSIPVKARYTPESYAEYLIRKEKRNRGEEVPVPVGISIIRKDGEIRHLETMRKEVLWNGERQYQVIYQDITERKQAEESLQESEEFNSTLLTNTPNAIFVTYPDGAIKYVNPAFETLTGFSLAEIIGMKTPYPWWPKDNKDKIGADLEETTPGEGINLGNRLAKQMTFQKKNGELFTVDLNATIINKNGKREYIMVIWIDITERKQAEEKILHLNQILQVLRRVNQLIVRTESEPELLQKACNELVQYRRYKMVWIGLKQAGTYNILPAAHAGDEKGYLSSIRVTWDDSEYGMGPTGTVIKTGQPSVVRDIASDPQYIPWRKEALQRDFRSSVALPLIIEQNKIIGAINVYSDRAGAYDLEEVELLVELAGDISLGIDKIRQRDMRKQVEEALRESEDKFAKAFNSSPNALIISQIADGIILEVNDTWEKLLGYSREEVLGKTAIAFNVMSPLDRQQAVSLLEKQGFVRELELEARRKSGEVLKVTLSIETIDIGGKRLMLTTMRDITERKLAEEALRKSEENFRRTLEDSPLGIRIVNTKGEVVYVNQSLLDIYGYTNADEFKSIPIKKKFTPEGYKEHLNICQHMAMGVSFPQHGETSIVRKDGEIRHLEILHKEVLWNGEKRYQLLYQDVTERKLLETERQRVEKLESIGTLAGGIAHDFNNLLTGIMGNISLARRYMEPKGKAFERLEEAEKASIRARDLTQQLLTFSRGGTPVKRVISIGKLIQESTSFALRGSKVKPEFSLPVDLWAIEADEGQINQVISNIVINAEQSMPQGGALNIEAKNLVIRSGRVLPLTNGDYVHIAIKDRGVGIPREHLGKIFDPFFTTKQKGSGLGLSTAYSIVKNHDGHIAVESKPGTGTTFHIYLPASEKQAPAEEEAVMETTLRGKGRILVMDDEEIIREMLSKMLSLVGYEVELVQDGAEAIERYAEAKGAKRTFDAVIMDLTIPGGMGGKEAITKLLEIDPDAKVIVSSGYATDPIMSGYKKFGFTAVLNKPYSVAEIEKTLKSLLKKK